MTKDQFLLLKPGDIVQHRFEDSPIGSHTWMVSATYGDRITLVETADMTNPEEWEVVHDNRN